MMTNRNILINPCLTIFILILFYSCAVADEGYAETKSISKIEYRFHDSSLPPLYHRSYSIILTPTELRYVVDSYGEIIKDTTIAISSAKWEESKHAIDVYNIRNITSKNDNHNCTGGTGISIEIFENDIKSFSGHNYQCDSQIYGNLGGNTKEFLGVLRKGIANDFFLYD